MSRILAIVVGLLLLLPLISADGDTEEHLGWAQSADSIGTQTISGHVVLDDGSIVVAGMFSKESFLGDDIIEATGPDDDTDMYVAKMNESGKWVSAFSFGSVAGDGIESIALHNSGDIILAGYLCLGSENISCGVEFINSSFTVNKTSNETGSSAFIGRFSYVGDSLIPIWVKPLTGDRQISIFDISVSPNGGIALGAVHSNNLTVGGLSIQGSESLNLALINFDSDGIPIWWNGVEVEGQLETFGGLCHSNDGYLHITATYFGMLYFNSNSTGVKNIHSSGGQVNFFAAQLDGEGQFTWNNFAGGPGEDWASDCAIDSSGDMHIVGQIENTLTLGEIYDNHINLTSNGWRDSLHVTINANGDWEEGYNFGSGGWENLIAITIDSRDNKIVTGTHTSSFSLGLDNLTDKDMDGDDKDIFVAQMDSSNQWDWAYSAGGPGDDSVYSITLGNNETPIIGIGFEDTITLSNSTLYTVGDYGIGIWYYAVDQDYDGILDGSDNCPRIANPGQQDSDSDLFGDVCDVDDDDDGIGDDWDQCTPGEIGWKSSLNSDHDSDGCRDVTEDYDDDNDNISDVDDLCPNGPIGWVSNSENDENQDGCADIDTDGDGFVDQLDKCPSVSDDQADLDGDGIGDACETDTDGDGIDDNADNCPTDSVFWTSVDELDYDQDGCEDESRDADDDGDMVLDMADDCPQGAINWNTSAHDHDSDGCHDTLEDLDDDNDGFEDGIDNCPSGYVGESIDGMDLDQDGCIDSSEDIDDDNDGVNDTSDNCRYTPAGMEVDSDGCSGVQLDDDNDGVHNLNDMCPSTPSGEIVSSTGCVKETNDEAKSSDDSDSSSSLTWIFFTIAGVLVSIALFVTYRPQPTPPSGPSDKQVVPISTVDDRGGQGDSGATSPNINDSVLDDNTLKTEVITDESGSASEDSSLVE